MNVSLVKPAPPPPLPKRIAYIPYDIPLRYKTDVRVRLVLPEDFNVLDAERLCRIIHAIARPR